MTPTERIAWLKSQAEKHEAGAKELHAQADVLEKIANAYTELAFDIEDMI